MGTGERNRGPAPEKQAAVDALARAAIYRAASAFRVLVRKLPKEKVYWLHSFKAGGYVEVRGDTALVGGILDEMDPDVVRIEFEAPTAVASVKGEPAKTCFDSTITRRDGRKVSKEYKRESSLNKPDARTEIQIDAQRAAAAVLGNEYLLVTDRALRRYHTRFWNSLALLCWRNRARNIPSYKEKAALSAHLNEHGNARLFQLLSLPDVDPAVLLGDIGRRIAEGLLVVELDQPLTRNSVFYRPRSVATPQSPDIETWKPSAKPARRLPPRGSFDESLYPLERLDASTWSDINVDLAHHQSEYCKRREALEMFFDGLPEAEIRAITGFGDAKCIEFIKRCARSRGDGHAVGWSGLGKFGHYRRYIRRAQLPQSNEARRETAGWSGALQSVLGRFMRDEGTVDDAAEDDLLDLIVALVLRRKRGGKTKLAYVDIHREVIAYLRRKVEQREFEADAYPLNTVDMGYQAVRSFCHELERGDASRWIRILGGETVAKRYALGRGHPPLATPYTYHQSAALDFQKIDNETEISFCLPDSTKITSVLPRWWLGGAACMYSGIPLADSASFEKQTTTEDVLELASVMCTPPPSDALLAKNYEVTKDGKWLASQIFPEIANSGIDLLHMDRAWAHMSREVLATVSSTLGCVICFGGSREWWIRAAIERTFRETAAASHTLPSTTGSSASDPARQNSAKSAVRYEIDVDKTKRRLQTKFREMLDYRGEGSYFKSHCERLKELIADFDSPWLPRPLPQPRQLDNPLAWINIPTVISCGSKKDPRAPHVRPYGIRFQGGALGDRADLDGRDAVLQVHRMDVTRARLVLAGGSGELLGSVLPEENYRLRGLPWRYVRLIRRNGSGRGLKEKASPAVEFVKEIRQGVAAKRPTDEGVIRSGAAGLALAGIASGMSRLDAEVNAHQPPSTSAAPRASSIVQLASGLVAKKRSVSRRI